YSIDPTTAAFTFIGNVTVAGNPIGLTGLAVHPTTRVHQGVTGEASPNNPRSLVSINKATGAATLIGALGRTLADITFRSDGTLFGLDGNSQDLYTVDLTTGATTFVGAPAVLPNQ